MAFCSKCGTKIEEGTNVCPNCGNPVTPEADTSSTGGNDFVKAVKELNNTTDLTSQFEASDISNNLLMGILSYIFVLVFIPIFLAPNSKYARFHANQGLMICIAEAVISILRTILVRIFIFRWIFNIILLVLFILSIIGIINVIQGKAKELPVIGAIRILK